MGNWNITIQGVGSHHNNNAQWDADLAAADFVVKLKSQGHNITSATFTHGGSLDLMGSTVNPTNGVIEIPTKNQTTKSETNK